MLSPLQLGDAGLTEERMVRPYRNRVDLEKGVAPVARVVASHVLGT